VTGSPVAPRPALSRPPVLRDPAVTPRLRDGLARLWNDVNNAGGAVGFVPPTTVADVLPDLDGHLAGTAAGGTRLVVGFAAERPVAAAFLCLNTHRLMRHWAWLNTVMVHPEQHRRGWGAALLGECAALGRDLGLVGLRLSYRDGLGLDRFYGSLGYREIGRVPAGLRLGPDEHRDSVEMWLPLG
jgi:GNAT superfamily N-acetyltransferase